MLKIFLWLNARLPLRFLHCLAWPIGSLLYVVGNNQRHITEVNLALCYPEWSKRRRRYMCWRSMVETSKNVLDSLKVWSAKDKRILKLIKSVSNDSLLEDAFAKKKGIILIIPHLGNWELVNIYCSSLMPVTGLYRPQKSKWLDQLMNQGRELFGTKALPATTQGVRGLLKALKNNGLIIILPDQNPGKGTGVFAPFFNISTNTPVLPVRMAQKTGAVIISAYARRLRYGAGYHIQFDSTNLLMSDEDINVAASAMNADIEALVRRHPEQYWWGYSRFRHRPAGEAPLYDKD